jgi:hypothetical protein
MTTPPARQAEVLGAALRGQIVEKSLRETLQWVSQPGDISKRFANLARGFDARRLEAVSPSIWTAARLNQPAAPASPRGNFAEMRAALARARAVFETCEPFGGHVAGPELSILRKDVVQAIRSLEAELGQPSEVHEDRVLPLVAALFGEPAPSAPAHLARGRVFRLAESLGARAEVLVRGETPPSLRQFLRAVDEVYRVRELLSLAMSADREAEPDRPAAELRAVYRSVQEAALRMDAEGFGPAERMTARLRLPGTSPMTVAEVLAWIEQFSIEEGLRFRNTIPSAEAQNIRQLCAILLWVIRQAMVPPQRSDWLPAEYQKPTVQVSLEEIAQRLTRVESAIRNSEAVERKPQS